MSNAIRIHRHPLSGHSHRVELFAKLAGINHMLVDVDLMAGEHKKEPFLSLNPSGQVPTVEDGVIVISDSNAILVYLARKYAPDWLPGDLLREAEVQKFLSLAAGEIAHGPAAARLITVFGAKLDAEQTKAVRSRLLERGILIGVAGAYGNVVRLQPPLCITSEDCQRVVEELGKALSETV